jgi:nitroreductase
MRTPPPKDNWDPERITYLRGDTEPVEISEEIIIASDIIDVIHNRTSIRQYTDQVVEEDKVELLLRAAMAAPSDGNKQPWEYYVISDRQLLQQLASALPSAKMLEHARLAITVCGDTTISESWELDCSAAGANILLAVTAIELGAVWTGVHPYSSRVNAVQSLLDLPDHIIPLNMIAIGYPDDDPTPKNKWKPSNIYYPVNSDANSAIVTAVLTNIFPNCTINANTDARIYGTSASNQISLAGGSKAELLNFPGQNSIQIQSSSDLFSVFRSGAVVTFQSSDGTVLKIPATKDVQTIFFNGEEGMVMQIHNNQVMLDNQIISTTPASIEGT